MQVIVIGASHAGIDFVDSLRRPGFAGERAVVNNIFVMRSKYSKQPDNNTRRAKL